MKDAIQGYLKFGGIFLLDCLILYSLRGVVPEDALTVIAGVLIFCSFWLALMGWKVFKFWITGFVAFMFLAGLVVFVFVILNPISLILAVLALIGLGISVLFGISNFLEKHERSNEKVTN